jgi:large subunit ribosomal protein L15
MATKSNKSSRSATATTASQPAQAARTLRIGTLKPAKGATHRRKRRGLGPASGLGGTAGRGHKGQRARKSGNVARWFEGGQMPIQRRLPKVGFTNIHRVPHQVVNLESLAGFEAGETVDRASLKAKRLIDRSDLPVKILGTGELSLALKVAVDAVSGSAREKIEAAGGSITLPEKKTPRPRGVKKPARTEARGGREAARAGGRSARGSKANKGQGKVRA